MTTLEHPSPGDSGHGPADAHGHDHPAWLAHHYDTAKQQYDSAVLGMWLFLATEILLFAGLFCAYAIYRANHPEVFYYGHRFLDVNLGAINTVVLLFSSFTMATAVWAAERGRRALTLWMLATTIACGFGFMGIKYVEYMHKIHDGLLWGKYYKYDPHHGEGGAEHPDAEHTELQHEAEAQQRGGAPATVSPPEPTKPVDHAPPGADKAAAPIGAAANAGAANPDAPSWVFQPADTGPRGLLRPGHLADEPQHAGHGDDPPRNVRTFFAVYFCMTGLHAVHVIAGMIAIAWVFRRTLRGDFTAAYFTPIPIVGLYWHVVDLVWIYLFPLLYLIH